jgi:glucose/arabinose dehydrogenase
MPGKIALASVLIAMLALIAPQTHAALPAGFVDITMPGNITNGSCLAVAPDGRIFVGQQNGVVRVIKNGVMLSTPFVAVQANAAGQERGLLGMTIDPGFESNGFLYLHYTTNAVSPNVVQRISRFTASGDVAAPGSELMLIESDPTPSDEELGGGMKFGPDGMLYVGIGDAEVAANAQVTNSLWGKVLRIRNDGTIPADNPFFTQNTGKYRAVWALGFRNPYTFSFDGTGRLFVNDVGSVGAAAREEINHVVAGANHGWPTCEGNCGAPNPALRNPVYFFLHTNGFTAITAGAFYSPSASLFPASYNGKYFFGDLATATIWLLDPATTNVTPFATGLPGGLVSMQVGPDGGLYYLVRSASSANSGSVGKIVSGVTALVPLASTWKYLDTGTNLPPGWADLAFNDSAWSNGVAQLGWGPNGETTLVRSNRADGSRMATTYFRKSFVVSNTAPYSNYVVSLVRDDGGVVYINGTEVFRSNMPTGAVTSATLAVMSVGGVDERAVFGGVANPSLLVNGTNVLAVEIHQNGTNAATDMSFDAALFGIDGMANLRAFLSGGELIVAYPSWANRFTLESAATLPTNNWTVVPNVPTPSGNELRVNLPPASNHRFFRLRSP